MSNKIGNIFKGDKVIWMVFFFLCMISIIEVYSASSTLSYKSGNFMWPVIKHMAILAGGVFVMICMLKVKCKYFKIVTPFMILSLCSCFYGYCWQDSLQMAHPDGSVL